MKARKVPKNIKEIIMTIESLEATSRVLWSKLYDYLDKIGVDSDSTEVSELQDGNGGFILIKWLEEGHKSDYDD